MAERMLSTREAAVRLGVSEYTVRFYGRTGRIRGAVHTTKSKRSPMRFPEWAVAEWEAQRFPACS